MTNKYAGPAQDLAVFSALQGSGFRAHIYDGGRCLFCNLQILDDYADDSYECVDRGQWHYTTHTTPQEPNGATP